MTAATSCGSRPAAHADGRWGLTSQNRYAMIFRLSLLKTQAARTRNSEKFVAMPTRGETSYP